MSNLVRPKGDRVLVQPIREPIRSASGIEIIEKWAPSDIRGVVVALGDGLESRRLAVERVIASCVQAVDEEFVISTAARERVRQLLYGVRDSYQPEHVCQVGDEVLFGTLAGTELELNGETYLLIREDDLEAVLTPAGVVS